MGDLTGSLGRRSETVIPSLEDLRSALVELYAKIAKLTWDDCFLHCDSRFGCCHELFCELARLHAWDLWGVELEPTGHPKLPLMGPSGCIAAPHYRPVCAMHCCEDNPTGLTGGHRDETWHLHYRSLKDYITKLETELVVRTE